MLSYLKKSFLMNGNIVEGEAKKKAKQISYDVFSKKLLNFMEKNLRGNKQNSIHLLR